MRILYITTIGVTMGFFMELIKTLKNEGHIVDIACGEVEQVPEIYRELNCNIYELACSRSPLNTGNVRAIKQIREIVENGYYDIVHCHTPIAAASTRVACKRLRGKTIIGDDGNNHKLKVFYTAHGFHFYKGAPIKNWLVYYPVEWLCAHWTDVLITINAEDFKFAQKRLHVGVVEKVNGVGIDVDRFRNTITDRTQKRKELGINDEATVLLSVGELNKNKNHQIVIKALAELIDSGKDYYYVIAGRGPQKEALIELAENLGVKDRVRLLGFRTDCNELYKTADLFVHPSIREGLPVSVIEAQAAGIVCIGTDIRGNRDLIAVENLYRTNSLEELLDRIRNPRKEINMCHQFDYLEVNQATLGIYENNSK